MPFTILVADDEIFDNRNDISRLPDLLRQAGYKVIAENDAERVYDHVWEDKPDLILLDVAFFYAKKKGIEICEAIRLNEEHEGIPSTPIILISGIVIETDDILAGFKAGADDYITRPHDWQIVLARIRANLPPHVFTCNDIKIDYTNHQVWTRRDGSWKTVHLPPLEFDCLKLLATNVNRIVPGYSFKEWVFGKDEMSDDLIAIYIWRLRKKLEPNPTNPIYIETIRGLGYRFNCTRT